MHRVYSPDALWLTARAAQQGAAERTRVALERMWPAVQHYAASAARCRGTVQAARRDRARRRGSNFRGKWPALAPASPPDQQRRLLCCTVPDTLPLAIPDEPMLVQQPYDYYAVLDFEATCEQGRRNPAGYQAEVIELPTVLLDGRTMRVVGEFQTYVKPVVNPTLTAFCTELTGIQQSWVDGAPTFEAALRQHTSWLRRHGLAAHGTPGYSWACVTCGDWDLKTMLPDQLRLLNQHDRGPGVKSRTASRRDLGKQFRRWVNIKKIYAKCVPAGQPQKASGMTGMLRGLGLTLEGRHHSGIDDCRNIANMVRALVVRGAVLECTTGGGSGAAASAHQDESSKRNRDKQLLQRDRKARKKARAMLKRQGDAKRRK